MFSTELKEIIIPAYPSKGGDNRPPKSAAPVFTSDFSSIQMPNPKTLKRLGSYPPLSFPPPAAIWHPLGVVVGRPPQSAATAEFVVLDGEVIILDAFLKSVKSVGDDNRPPQSTESQVFMMSPPIVLVREEYPYIAMRDVKLVNYGGGRQLAESDPWMDQFDVDPKECAKVMFTVVSGAILASPSIYSAKVLTPVDFFAMLVLLIISFFALLPLLFFYKAYPNPAAKLQSLIGTTCAAAAVPTVAAGLIPNGLLRLVVWVPFALLVLALTIVFANKGPSRQEVPEDHHMPV